MGVREHENSVGTEFVWRSCRLKGCGLGPLPRGEGRPHFRRAFLHRARIFRATARPRRPVDISRFASPRTGPLEAQTDTSMDQRGAARAQRCARFSTDCGRRVRFWEEPEQFSSSFPPIAHFPLRSSQSCPVAHSCPDNCARVRPSPWAQHHGSTPGTPAPYGAFCLLE